MTEALVDSTVAELIWPSINSACPEEEGGPIARTGFNYQDEIAVGFLIEMLGDGALLKVHLETHDDIVLIWDIDGQVHAEYVQVKASEEEKFWSISDLCQRKQAEVGTSIFEKSLSRDRHSEHSLFRIVTLRPVVAALKPLTYPRDAPARQEATSTDVDSLLQKIDDRCPDVKSPKGQASTFWVANCLWDHRDSEAGVQRENLLRLMQLAHEEGRTILFEPAEVLLLELRAMAKTAGGAKWLPDPSKKIVDRASLRAWWDKRLTEIVEGATSPSGEKLASKMAEAGLSPDMSSLAMSLRRTYASEIRTPRYLDASDAEGLQHRVQSEVASLRARFIAGELDGGPQQFHALCVSRMDEINAERPAGEPDRSAFLKGCLYDITDRCLLRFARPSL